MQRYPDGRVVVVMKDPRERRIERITAALLVVWLGVMWSVHEPHGLAAIGFGAIFLGSAVLQRVRGFHSGILTWVLGGVLLGMGIADLSSNIDVSWFGISVALVGLWLLAKAARRSPPRRPPFQA